MATWDESAFDHLWGGPLVLELGVGNAARLLRMLHDSVQRVLAASAPELIVHILQHNGCLSPPIQLVSTKDNRVQGRLDRATFETGGSFFAISMP